MKIFKLVMHLLILIMLIGTSYLCGIYSTKYQRAIEENKSTVTTIAVVNADIGGYASELICYPDTNFQMTSLTAAKEGILNDRYAAYILIPEDFSANVESVNRQPVKSQITYAIAEGLRQDAQFKVINDIHNFIVNLNANVSYMYVDAILKELHSVQDDSTSIMQNDIADMKAIVSVENAELIEEVVYEPLEVVETEIEYLDLSDDYEKLSDAVTAINTTYEENVTSAETELEAIRERGQGVYGEISVMSEVFAGVDILTDDEGNVVYEEGMKHVLEYPDVFVEDAKQKKLAAKISLGYKEGDPEPEKPDSAKQAETEAIQNDVEDIQETSLEELSVQESDEIQEEEYPATEEQESTSTELWNPLVDSKTDEDTESEEKKPGEDKPEEDPTTKEILLYKLNEQIAALETLEKESSDVKYTRQIQAILKDIDEFKDLFEEYYTNAIIAINDIPDADTFVQGIRDIYNDEIVKPIDAEIAAEAERVESAVSSVGEALETYVMELDEYDFMEYLEEEKVREQLDLLYVTIEEMEEEIIETDDAYITYIDEVVTTADSNTAMLQENLDTSYEQTVTNIGSIMDDFKQNRTSLNEQNVLMLNDITEKLPYTRLGNLEYLQVYDFIVTPLETDDRSVVKVNLSPTAISIDMLDIACLFIGIIALIAIYISVQLIYRKELIKRKEGVTWQMELR